MEMFYIEPSQSNPQPPAPDTYNLSNKKKQNLDCLLLQYLHRVFPFLKFTFAFYSAAMTPVCSHAMMHFISRKNSAIKDIFATPPQSDLSIHLAQGRRVGVEVDGVLLPDRPNSVIPPVQKNTLYSCLIFTIHSF